MCLQLLAPSGLEKPLMKWRTQKIVLATRANAKKKRTKPIERSIITELERNLSIKGVPASIAATKTYQEVSISPAKIAMTILSI